MSTPQKVPPPTNVMAPSRACRHWLLNYADELDAKARSLEGHETRKPDMVQYKSRATKARNLLANYEKMQRGLKRLQEICEDPNGNRDPAALAAICRTSIPTKTRRDSC